MKRERTDVEAGAAPLEKFIYVFAKSEVIFEENSSGQEMYVVHSGGVRLYKDQGTSKTLLATLRPGEFFGEMALVDNSPRSATAAATQDNTRLVALDRAKFLYLLRHQPEFALIIMQKMSNMLRQTTEAAGTTGRRHARKKDR